MGRLRKPVSDKKHPNIVSVQLPPDIKGQLDDICHHRGMSIKILLGRLIEWFDSLDKTEQSIVLGQVEMSDERPLAQMVLERNAKSKKLGLTVPAKRPKRAGA